VGVRPVEPVQLPKQQEQVQGRRGKTGIQLERVLVVLYDFAHPSGTVEYHGTGTPGGERTRRGGFKQFKHGEKFKTQTTRRPNSSFNGYFEISRRNK